MPFPFDESDVDDNFERQSPDEIDYAAIAAQQGSDDDHGHTTVCPRHGLRIDTRESTGELPQVLECDMCLREFVSGVVE